MRVLKCVATSGLDCVVNFTKRAMSTFTGRVTARQVALDAGQAHPGVVLAPASHLYASYAQLLGDVHVLQPISCQQHDLCTLVSLDRTSWVSSARSSLVNKI